LIWGEDCKGVALINALLIAQPLHVGPHALAQLTADGGIGRGRPFG
jgi:hypothetical protein